MEIVQSNTTQTPASGSTLTWTGRDFGGGAETGRDVVAIGIELASGGTARASDFSRITLKRGTLKIVDVLKTHLDAYVRRFSRANFSPSTDLFWLLPLYILEAKADAERYASAFPANGEDMVLEILMGAFTAGTESARLFTVRAPEFGHPQFGHPLSLFAADEALNIPASATLNSGFTRAKADVRAFTQLLTNVTDSEVYAGGRLVDRLRPQMIGTVDLYERGAAPATGVVARKLVPVVPRGTQFEFRLTTGGSWAATDRVGLWGFNPSENPAGVA